MHHDDLVVKYITLLSRHGDLEKHVDARLARADALNVALQQQLHKLTQRVTECEALLMRANAVDTTDEWDRVTQSALGFRQGVIDATYVPAGGGGHSWT